jgi:hypothetical protein
MMELGTKLKGAANSDYEGLAKDLSLGALLPEP